MTSHYSSTNRHRPSDSVFPHLTSFCRRKRMTTLFIFALPSRRRNLVTNFDANGSKKLHRYTIEKVSFHYLISDLPYWSSLHKIVHRCRRSHLFTSTSWERQNQTEFESWKRGRNQNIGWNCTVSLISIFSSNDECLKKLSQDRLGLNPKFISFNLS